MLKDIVIWEECARDGAQAKTIMNADERIHVAHETAALFGDTARHHLIFAAGFPSSSPEEFRIIRKLSEEVRECHLATHGRATRRDIERGLEALKGAALPRLTFFVPMSPMTSEALGFSSPREAKVNGLHIAEYAKSRAGDIPVDVALVDVPQLEPESVAEYAYQMAEAGIEIVKLCDSRGVFYPKFADQFYHRFFTALGSETQRLRIGVHNHNDLEFANSNNFKGLECGANVVSSSWLGLGERNGLAQTETTLMAVHLSQQNHHPQCDKIKCNWPSNLRIHMIKPVADLVSKYTGISLKITDAIVGDGVNSISTGTPFQNPGAFQPFDPVDLLGIPRKVYLTQLSSTAVVRHMAELAGYELNSEQSKSILKWVKTYCHKQNISIMPEQVFKDHLFSILNYQENSLLIGEK